MFQLITFHLALVFRQPINAKSRLKLTYIFYFSCCCAIANSNFNQNLTTVKARAAEQ